MSLPRIPIFKKQFSDLWRERTFVLVIGLILFVVFSMSLLIAVTAFVYNPELLVQEPIDVAIVGFDFPAQEGSKINWIEYTNQSRALADFDAAEVDAVVTAQYVSPLVVDIILPSNPVKNSLLSSVLKDAFEKLQDQLLSIQPELDLLTPADIRTTTQPVRGLGNIYAILFGFALPLFLLIPTFLLGNLFVDMVTEDFERGNNDLLFTTYSPLKYLRQILGFGFTVNVILVGILQLVMYLNFSFLVVPLLTFSYALLFYFVVGLLALVFAVLFKIKTTAQLSYSFSVLCIFLLSPYVSFFPIKVISTTMLGIDLWHPLYLFGTLGLISVLYVVLHALIKRQYYV